MNTWIDRLKKLDGEDYIYISLIYLEAFIVNILQNADVKVPERVAVKKVSQGVDEPTPETV
jgi:hypothetical protein